MKFGLIGASSQLGRCLLSLDLHNIIPIHVNVSDEADVKNNLNHLSATCPFMTIINLASYNKVDEAETNHGMKAAYAINGIGSRNVALACKHLKYKYIYVSTGYVFDGIYGYYDEDNTRNLRPLNKYGQSKLYGENSAILCPDHLVIRTSALYSSFPSRSKGSNFVLNVLSQISQNKVLQLPSDEYVNPTYCIDLAHWILNSSKNATGIRHVVNSNSCSWLDFADEIVKKVFPDRRAYLFPAGSSNSVASRPRIGSLTSKYKDSRLRDWRVALHSFLDSHVFQIS